MRIHFSDEQAKELVVDLEGADERVTRAAEVTMRRAAGRVKKNMKHAARGHRYLAELPSTVGLSKIGSLSYEVGFDKRGQGNLANIVVYGSVNNGPVFSIAPSLEREIPWLERHLGGDAEDSTL